MTPTARKPPRKWPSRLSWLSGSQSRARGIGLVPLAAFSLLATPTPAWPETVRAFVARVYRPYLRDPTDPRTDIAWFDRGLFTRDFLRLVRADQKLAGGEEGYIDADPICACQDWGHFSYRVIVLRGGPARRFATLRLHNWDRISDITLVLVRTRHGRFLIDDLQDETYIPSFKIWMTKALRAGPIK